MIQIEKTNRSFLRYRTTGRWMKIHHDIILYLHIVWKKNVLFLLSLYGFSHRIMLISIYLFILYNDKKITLCIYIFAHTYTYLLYLFIFRRCYVVAVWIGVFHNYFDFIIIEKDYRIPVWSSNNQNVFFYCIFLFFFNRSNLMK